MTLDDLSDVTITTEERFNTLLTQLLVAGRDGDVQIEGAWECANSADDYDWEVNVVKLLTQRTGDA